MLSQPDTSIHTLTASSSTAYQTCRNHIPVKAFLFAIKQDMGCISIIKPSPSLSISSSSISRLPSPRGRRMGAEDDSACLTHRSLHPESKVPVHSRRFYGCFVFTARHLPNALFTRQPIGQTALLCPFWNSFRPERGSLALLGRLTAAQYLFR